MKLIENNILKIIDLCKKHKVHKLFVFGSVLKSRFNDNSDIDFVVYGCKDLLKLERDLESIDTLRKIDIFDYDSIKNPFLLEDIEKYGKQIY